MIACATGPGVSPDFLLGDYDGRTKPECNDRPASFCSVWRSMFFSNEDASNTASLFAALLSSLRFSICHGFLLRHDQRILAQPIAHLGHHYRPHVSGFSRRVLQTSLRTWRTLASVVSGLILVLIPTDVAREPFVSALAGCLAFGIYTLCIFRLYQRYRRSENRVESTRLGYLVYGGFVSVVLNAFDLLPIFELPSPALGHIWTTVYMYFWMQVILRSRLLDLQDILGRGLALLALSSMIALAYVALLIWVEGSVGLFFFNTIAASVLIVFVFEPLKRAIDVWVGRLLFRSTHDLENTISKIKSQLANVISLEDLFDRVIRGLERFEAHNPCVHPHVRDGWSSICRAPTWRMLG